MSVSGGRVIETDIAVVGAGLAGLSAAYYFSSYAGYKVAVIDGNSGIAADNRTTAVLYKNKDFFRLGDAWKKMSERGAPIREVILHDDISDNKSGMAHFYAADIGCPYFSMNIPNAVLHKVLTSVMLRGKSKPKIIKSSVTGTELSGGFRILYTDDGTVIRAKLVIAADGAGSFLRKNENISIREKPYGQTALIGFVEHKEKHGCKAAEFYGNGRLLTFVPTENPNISAIVWCGGTDAMNVIRMMPTEKICRELYTRSCGIYGNMRSFSVDGAFPLVHRLADSFTSERIVFIGETIHTVHPLGAQGYNLSLSDIKTLSGIVSEYGYAGLDIGSYGVLKKYETLRKGDLYSRSAVLHTLASQITEQGIIRRKVHGKILAGLGKNRFLKNMSMRYLMSS